MQQDDGLAVLLDAIVAWAKADACIRGVALVGSRARGTARPDSDIDLVLLTADPAAFRADSKWLGAIDWTPTGVRPSTWRDVQYGNVWSRHVCFSDTPEIEFSFAPLSWADGTPLDAGTKRVIARGCCILYDPDGRLAALRACASVAAGRESKAIGNSVERGSLP